MKIGFFVNDIQTEGFRDSTTRLSMDAHNRKHKVFYLSPDSFALDPDDIVRARATFPPGHKFKSLAVYLKALQSEHAGSERIELRDLDIIMLRNDPSAEPANRGWASHAGILFSRLVLQDGVIVVNDPNGLTSAMNKMYFQLFPEEVRPATLITRARSEIRSFARECGSVVIKPLSGSGGTNVFMVRNEDSPNLNQMIDAIIRDGYVIAQEYLEEAEQGDIRLFLMNGEPLRFKGHYGAFRRIHGGGDLRSNIHAGGRMKKAEIGEVELQVAEIVRPKLVQDGMFLVGLDIVGSKLMEINVFSPGGLGSAQKLEKVNFCTPILDALERKVASMRYYKRHFNNVEMAVL